MWWNQPTQIQILDLAGRLYLTGFILNLSGVILSMVDDLSVNSETSVVTS
jgi:hypothetical protein